MRYNSASIHMNAAIQTCLDCYRSCKAPRSHTTSERSESTLSRNTSG